MNKYGNAFKEKESTIGEHLYIVKRSNESPFHLIGHLYLALDLLARSSANKSEIKNSKLADFYVHEALTFIEQNFSKCRRIQSTRFSDSLSYEQSI